MHSLAVSFWFLLLKGLRIFWERELCNKEGGLKCKVFPGFPAIKEC